HRRKARVESERRSDARGSDGQQRTLHKGKAAARGLVSVVPCSVVRDHHIVAVVAAKQEDADQRLVVGSVLGESVHQPKATEAGSRKAGGGRTASGLQKVPAVP